MKRENNNLLTYISLFSSAGLGCFGFKLEDFDCVATVEIIERRMKIQRLNEKCKYESGYIVDDIVKENTKIKIREQISLWKKNHHMKDLDVLIATPPCQGMSVANHKKGNELGRNSLVVESIKLVHEILPKFFVFENVRAFLNSICTDVDGKDKKIREAIELNLGGKYNIHYQIMNFKDYGNPSSRTRTLVIGVRKDLFEITPIDLMPDIQQEITVRDVIGGFRPLKKMGEIDENDVFHNFRSYPERMGLWIRGLKEGESAFDNDNPICQPNKVVNGEMFLNVKKNGDKYRRCYWDKPGACIHTRNDILASQSTIHPSDDRVYSIRELMKLMTVPDTFKWTEMPEPELNKLSLENKKMFLKKEEFNIRQSIGEAVPTTIFRQIARKMKKYLRNKTLDEVGVEKLILANNLENVLQLKNFLQENINNYSFAELSKIVELSNAHRLKNAAYYTRQDICYTLIKDLPDASCYHTIKILEPAVGVGNFLPLLIEKYKSVSQVEIDLVDIDANAMSILEILIKKLKVPKNVKINFIVKDFLLSEKDDLIKNTPYYDIVIGNPPFGKISNDVKLLKQYKKDKINTKTSNLFSFFLEKSINYAQVVALIVPKSFLSAPEFDKTRNLVSEHSILKIVDYGERGFKGVKIETIGVIINTKMKGVNNRVIIESYVNKTIIYKDQNYICSKNYPYWLIYRDNFFDTIASKLHFDVFAAYRDRQITKRITSDVGRVRVLKSRNIGNNKIIDIPKYDAFVDDYSRLSISKFINNDKAILVPNLTYNPRACFLPGNAIVDGSVAVLLPKKEIQITESDLDYYNSEEFVNFYRIVRNFGTRSLNIDSNAVYFFGLMSVI